MSVSMWEEPIVVGGSKFEEGKRYTIELTDVKREKAVVQWLKNMPKEVAGKEYASLTSEQKAVVDGYEYVPEDYFQARDGKDAQKKPLKQDRVAFQFREVETGAPFLYDTQFWMTQSGGASNKLLAFLEQAVGYVPGESDSFRLIDIMKPGDKFSAFITKGKNNFSKLDVDSIVRADMAPKGVSERKELSEGAQKLVAYLKANSTGQSVSSIIKIMNSGELGVEYNVAQTWWNEVRTSGTVYSKDGGKTFGFE